MKKNTMQWRGKWPGLMTAESPEDCIRQLLLHVGEDPNREGLRKTPARFVRALLEMTQGYDMSPAEVMTAFEDGAEDVDEMVLLKDIPFVSLCEHHLAPFFGTAHIAYLPHGKVIGLSKLARLTDLFARRLQVQERLTTQIAKALQEHLQPLGVGVILEARHMCMECRGVRKPGSVTVTSKLLGVFKDKPEVRQEFLSLVHAGK